MPGETGRTGFPVVDAGMRQLARQGWMHNRARLIVGSFLTKDLHLDWRAGEAHFMRHLLCGDEAQNNGNWQWIASVGVDPAPYFRRMYNPAAQQQRHDPDGAYVRRWCPELRDVPLAQARRAVEDERRRAGGCRLRDRIATTRRRSSTTRASASARWRATGLCRAELASGRAMAPPDLYVQRDRPPGVPPLHLTGERTLPDVPEENYWYRRHLAVYEWIAARAHGRHVVDLACGEGYGSAVLGRTAASVVGVDANPEAFEHARLRYTGGNVSFERNMIETWSGDVDCVVLLQTIEHVQDPDAVLVRLRDLVGPRGVLYVSTPNVLTLAPAGEQRSGNPWHVREYRPAEYRALCERRFGRVELLGLFHARKLRLHQFAIEHAGWDAVHRRLGLTKRFYDRFTPAISARDFRLRRGALAGALDLLAVLRP